MELTPDRVALINGLLDFILLNVQQKATALKNYRVVPIHDLVKKLHIDVSLTTLSASLAASQGTLSDLTTIRRVGDATLTSQGNTIFISLQISVDYLELFFHKYVLQLSIIKISGDKLRLNVKKNLIDLFLVLKFNELECEMHFERFKLIHFSDIDVEITGFSILNPAARKIADWIVDYFNSFIVKEVAEPYAKKLFNSAISDKDFLRRLFGYAITGMVRGAAKNTNHTDPQPSASSEINQQPLTCSEEHPVAPARSKRNVHRFANVEQQNNISSSQQNNALATKPAAASNQNNIRSQTSLASSQSNGAVTLRTQDDVTVRNNLRNRRNEIIIQPKKLFSSKRCKVGSTDHIRNLKPTVL